jgi:hypothetical protein
MFLCAANPELSFLENLAALKQPPSESVIYRIVLPGGLRLEVLERLSQMNVTAATLFPDLTGLARSLRIHRRPPMKGPLPWGPAAAKQSPS